MARFKSLAARALLVAGCSWMLILGSARAESHDAMLDGARVHYVTAGEGDTTIVMVHGWICTHEVWAPQLEGLADRVSLIAIDLPGHGQSGARDDIDYTMEHLARGIAAVMDDAGVGRAVIMGHSNGVPVIRQFYRMHPERTSALIAADGNLVQTFTLEQAQPFLEQLESDAYPNMVRGMFGTFLPEDHDAAEREAVIEMVMATPKHVGLSSMRGALDPAVLAPEPIEVPLLVINAESPAWTADYESKVREMSPEVDYRTMTGVKHLLQMDEPEEFNRHIVDFLEANDL